MTSCHFSLFINLGDQVGFMSILNDSDNLVLPIWVIFLAADDDLRGLGWDRGLQGIGFPSDWSPAQVMGRVWPMTGSS